MNVISLKQHGACRCPRCWHWHFSDLNFGHCEGDVDEKGRPVDMTEKLCNKCTFIILTCFPNHPAVDHIMNNLITRGLKIEDMEGLDIL